MSRRARIALYTGFALFCLVAGLVLTFPYDALGRRLEAEAAKAVPGAVLVINEVGPALPLGVRLANIVYEGPGKDGQPGAKLRLERIRVRPALSVLWGKPAVSFDVQAFGGSADGTFVNGRNERVLTASIDGMQLSDTAFEKLSGLQMSGTLAGKAQLAMDPRGSVTDGFVQATLDTLRIKSGKVAGFTLPATDLGSPEADIAIEKGQAKINKLRAKGADAVVDVTGSVAMRPLLAQSEVRGQLKVTPAQSWLDRNPAIKGVMSFAGSFKKPDGSLEIPLNGPLSRPVSLPGFGMGGMR